MVSTSAVHGTLNQTGPHGRRPKRTPLLRKSHNKDQLIFAKEYQDKPQSFWENVLWTDETQIELFGNAHQQFVYRRCNEAYKEKNNSKAWWRTHNAVGLLCCIWYWRPWLYHRNHEIRELSRDFRVKCPSSVRKLGLSQGSQVLQQDKDPKHNSNRNGWKRKKRTVLKWQSQSDGKKKDIC